MSPWVPSSRSWKLAGSSASASLQKSRTSQMQIWDATLVEKRSVLPETGTEWQRSARGTLTDTLVARHLLGGRKEDRGFLAGEGRKQRRLRPMEKLQCRWGYL